MLIEWPVRCAAQCVCHYETVNTTSYRNRVPVCFFREAFILTFVWPKMYPAVASLSVVSKGVLV